MRIARTWAMPTSRTFDCPPIASLLLGYCKGVTVDPFAGNSGAAWYTNDLNPATKAKSHLPAELFLANLLVTLGDGSVDCVLFDPPYSPRQITECYAAAGLTAGMKDTQNAALYARCRELIAQLVRPGGHVLSFGWNSCGMGKDWERVETLLVAHGGAHNDTICVVDRKPGGTE